MRGKYDSEDSRAFKCCFCVPVRVGTILLGLWHVMIHLTVLGCLVVASLHPELLRDSVQPGSSMNTDGIIVYESNNADSEKKDDQEVIIQYETPSINSPEKIRKENLCMFFALVMCTFLVAVMLVYGAIKSRPSCLMPFFCLQVFDFCLTCLWVVGYMTYAPDIKVWIVQQGMADWPGMKHFLQMDDQWLMLLGVIVLILILTVKAYLIQMVWSCYKYLQLRNANRSVVREYTVDPDSEMLLPPKYEEAIKVQAATGPPPPPYTA